MFKLKHRRRIFISKHRTKASDNDQQPKANYLRAIIALVNLKNEREINSKIIVSHFEMSPKIRGSLHLALCFYPPSSVGFKINSPIMQIIFVALTILFQHLCFSELLNFALSQLQLSTIHYPLVIEVSFWLGTCTLATAPVQIMFRTTVFSIEK